MIKKNTKVKLVIALADNNAVAVGALGTVLKKSHDKICQVQFDNVAEVQKVPVASLEAVG